MFPESWSRSSEKERSQLCQCNDTSFHLIENGNQEDSTRTRTIILAVTLSIGFLLLIIIIFIIIYCCLKNKGKWIFATGQAFFKPQIRFNLLLFQLKHSAQFGKDCSGQKGDSDNQWLVDTTDSCLLTSSDVTCFQWNWWLVSISVNSKEEG